MATPYLRGLRRLAMRLGGQTPTRVRPWICGVKVPASSTHCDGHMKWCQRVNVRLGVHWPGGTGPEEQGCSIAAMRQRLACYAKGNLRTLQHS